MGAQIATNSCKEANAMQAEAASCSRRRINGVSWIAFVVTAAALIFLNLDGYHNEYPRLDSFGSEPPTINWTHGWPLRAFGRSSIYIPSAGISAPTPRVIRGNNYAISSRWPFDGVPIAYVYPLALAADVLLFVTLCAGTLWSASRMGNKLQLRLRFNLKLLFALVTVVAVVLAFQVPAKLPRQFLQYTAEIICGFALLVVVCKGARTVVECLRAKFNAKPVLHCD
jgi:hypothetical protein